MTMHPAVAPITARHNAYFAQEFQFRDADGQLIDLTGHTGRMQVRQYGAQPGDAIIDLNSVSSDVEGVWVKDIHSLQVRIDRTTLAAAYAALSGGIAPGGNVLLEYDIAIDPPSSTEPEIWLAGGFTIKAGDTIP
jgi:hypothetical protein